MTDQALKPLWKILLPVRGIAIILVVLGHSSIIPLALNASREGEGSLCASIGDSWLLTSPLLTVILELARVSVPLFLFLSGHYLASVLLTWDATWKSAGKLLQPFLFWSLVGWAFSWRTCEGGWDVREFLDLLVSGRVQLGYYFIVLIIQYYILAHWIVPRMRANPSRMLLLAFLVQLSVHAYDYVYLLGEQGHIERIELVHAIGPFPAHLFPRFMFFVVLGIWAGTEPDRLREIVATKFPYIIIGAIVSAVLVLGESGYLLRFFHKDFGWGVAESLTRSTAAWKVSTSVWSLCATLLILALSLRLTLFGKLLQKLGKEAYMIFLLHGMALEFLKAFLLKADPPFRWDGGLGLAIFVAFGLLVPLGIGFVVRRCVKLVPLRRVLIGH